MFDLVGGRLKGQRRERKKKEKKGEKRNRKQRYLSRWGSTIRVYGFELGIYIYKRASDQKVRRVLHSLKPASTALSDLSYRNEGFRSTTPRCYSSRLIRGNAPE